MSSEKLASAQSVQKGNLGGAWDILSGAQGQYTDLGVARRFGGAAVAYSLRDIGAMGDPVVRVRREPNDTTTSIDDEENFSANQVQSGVLEDWVNGKLEGTLPADIATAAAAFSLRKVKADYGIPTTVVNGTENFPATVPSSGSPADIGNGFTVHRFSDGVADSESVTVSGGTITVTAIASGTGSFSGGCRIKGLSDNKQYTVSGEFRVTSQGTDGDGVALVDISDATAGTDEDSITTSSTTFTPFFIDAGYNGGSSNNFVDLQANSNGSNSGTLTAEFRNIKIIENKNSAVRIRRSSDDEEVVVGFDSDNKVSASSPVTATPSGSTTATTLGGFLTESNVNLGMGNTFFDQNDQVDIAGASATGFTATVAKNNTSDIDIRAGGQGYDNVKKGTITISYTIVQNTFSTEFTVQLWQLVDGDGYKIVDTVPSGTTGSRSITFENTDTNGSIVRFVASDHLVSDGEVLQISNLTITASKHTAAVHTWYDQAGVNNAVQETSANQPKIAENGALLTDGIDFDGTDDFLESTTLTSIYTGTDTASSAFVVVNSDAASTTQYIIGAGNTSLSNPMYNTLFHSGGNIGWQARDDSGTLKSNLTATPYIADKMYLVSNINSGTTTDFNSNAVVVDNGADSDLGVKTINTVKLGARGNAASSPLNGSMKEAIFYATDQSDNRFKIESNINNYYGLYNDANEVTGAFTASGAASFTPNGTDGFTVSNDSSNAFVGLELNQILATGEKVYVSFNLSIDSGANTSPILNIREGSISGSAASDEGIFTPNEGFNSTVFTSDSGGDARYITFKEDNTDPSVYTISDFKVSRIARIGFVQAWYDQSGNGNTASKSVASNQPKIVHNGNQLRLENKTPAIGFDRNPSFSTLAIGTAIANEPYTFFATTVHNGAFYFRLFADSATNAPPTLILNSASGGSLEYEASDSDTSGTLSTTAVLSDNIVSGFSGVNGGADGIIRINGTNLKTDISRTQTGDDIKHIGRFPNTSATFSCMESLVIYELDLTSEFDTIERELAQPINIL